VSEHRREHGAAAVEMAIVLPLLLVLVFGIVDFGRLLFAEVMVTGAAREGARMVAMGYSTADATTRIQAASPGLGFAGGLATPTYTTCPASPTPTDAASATVQTAGFDWLLVDAFVPITAPQPSSTASMKCGG
jgi:Flp pilus assembly protein TadG